MMDLFLHAAFIVAAVQIMCENKILVQVQTQLAKRENPERDA